MRVYLSNRSSGIAEGEDVRDADFPRTEVTVLGGRASTDCTGVRVCSLLDFQDRERERREPRQGKVTRSRYPSVRIRIVHIFGKGGPRRFDHAADSCSCEFVHPVSKVLHKKRNSCQPSPTTYQIALNFEFILPSWYDKPPWDSYHRRAYSSFFSPFAA